MTPLGANFLGRRTLVEVPIFLISRFLKAHDGSIIMMMTRAEDMPVENECRRQ